MSRIGPLNMQHQEVIMSPSNRAEREEPSNADLKQLILDAREELGGRLGVLEYHLVDPKKPERTLPIRVQQLEKSAKAFRWAGAAVLGGALAAAGSWVWDRMQGKHGA